MRKKKCGNPDCGKMFEPDRPFQKGCCFECQVKIGMIAVEKKRAKALAEAKRQQKEKEKSDRKRIQEKKKALRTRSQWYQILQREVNRYILLRDRDKPCCTCNDLNPAHKYDAGHFLTVGGHPDTRFNPINIHKQCVNCNQFNGGRPLEYRKFMIETYGEKEVEKLEGPQKTLREQFPTIQDIENEIEKYKKWNKELLAQS